MKVIKQWKDIRYNVTNTIYELPNETLFLHTKDEKTVDSIFSIASKLGSFYNDTLKVKGGTAHFLEHVIAGNPNRIFKTKNSIDSFEFGSKKYPKIYSNAWTSRLGSTFHGTTNNQGEVRLLRRLASIFHSDDNYISKAIEKERKVILSELGQKDKPEKNAFLKQSEFMFEHLSDEYKKYILGTQEDIESISLVDLKKFYENIFTKGNVILSLQSPNDISKESVKYLLEIDSQIKETKEKLDEPTEKMTNSFRYRHFQEEKATNIYIEIEMFGKESLRIDYNERARRKLSYELIDHLIFQIMREKKGYVYSSETFFIQTLMASHNIKGVTFSTNLSNFKKSVDLYQSILENEVHKFLASKSGKKWFESQVSRIIFPNTSPFDDDYARATASNYLSGYDIYDYEKFKNAVMDLKTTDLEKYLDGVLNTPHHVWIVSDQDEKTIEKILKSTKYFKHQSTLKPIEPV